LSVNSKVTSVWNKLKPRVCVVQRNFNYKKNIQVTHKAINDISVYW